MGFWGDLMRRKTVSEDTLGDTNLARVLGLVDLSCLAIGSTLGLGIYVLAGDVAKNEAGPAVVISFLVAAVASLFAALCYAEFAARVPKAGSAYVYSYVCVGEFIAFVIGWNLILEYVIGTASVARGYSTYVDSIFDKKMANAFTSCCGMDIDFLSPYPDFFAFALVFLLSVLLAMGVKESTQFNNVFTVCNLVVVTYVIVCGLFKVDIKNWKVDPSTVDDPDNKYKLGDGGFFPFGFSGMMAGAARCFYGFVGFDAVATTGEEAKNPQRTIPLSIVIGLTVIFFSYFGVSAVLTLMWPYYLQEDDAPIPAVFDHLGWESARWIVTVGALFGLSSSLLGALFPLPRILYAMAKDGLIFRPMAAIHPRFHTPFWSTLFAGVFAAVMAAVFDLEQLVDMMSIGTLLAYTLVGVCVLVLRYRDESIGMVMHDTDGDAVPVATSTDHLLPEKARGGILARTFNTARLRDPTHATASLVNYVTIVYGVITVGFCGTIVYGADAIMDVEAWAVALTVVLGAAMLVCVAAIFLQPQSKAHLFFKVPLVPFLPMLSVFVNVYLMMKLSSATWIRFGCWMAIGLLVYFGYGLWFSTEGKKNKSHADSSHARGRPSGLVLAEVKSNITINIEPATPRNGSASASPHSDRPGGLEGSHSSLPASEICVETCPTALQEERLHGEINAAYVDDDSADDSGEETRQKHVKDVLPSKGASDTDGQEATILYMARMAKHQRGLHAVIVKTLRSTWSDSGRGRQLSVHQTKVDEGRLRAAYLAPFPAVGEFGPELTQLAAEDVSRHADVCKCLGVPADGKPRPIHVSAEVHSEDPAALDAPSTVEVLPDDDTKPAESQATGPYEEHPDDGADQLKPATDDVTPDSMTSEADVAIQAIHGSVCECLQRRWIDLGKGALLADLQRARYSDVTVSVSAPTEEREQPPPVSPEELEMLNQLLSHQHAVIVQCMSAPLPPPTSTPPNTPTSHRHHRPELTPLNLNSESPKPAGAIARRPLSRAHSGEAGFSTIPPQSPDSPYAKRVGTKFVIIPVDGDGTDSEREEDAADQADAEVARAIRSVQDQMRSVLAPADDASSEEGDDEREATPTPTCSDDDEDAATLTPAAGGDADGSEEGDDRGAATPTPPASEAAGSPTPLGDQAEETAAASESQALDADNSGETTPKALPEVRQAMGTVLSQLLASQKRGPPPPPTPPGFTPPSISKTPVRRNTNPKLAAAPPEPSMKDKLDEIIAQAVAKAARRVTEHHSSSGDDSPDRSTSESTPDSAAKSSTPASESPLAAAVASAPPAEPEPEPKPEPPLSQIGSGMHRVRSKKGRPAPSFDMKELMARFEKK